MDPIKNPYAPGAGTPPPELAGREELIRLGRVALERVAQGRPNQSLILVGLRGVGKTVLLNKLNQIAEDVGFKANLIEAHEGKSLPEMLFPVLRAMLLSISFAENAKEKTQRALRALKGFLSGVKFSVGEFDFSLGMDAEPGLADSGNIESDLPDLLTAVAEAAKAAGKPIALFIDELQYISELEFSALIMAVHRINQRQLPFIMIGAGLPQIRALAGNSKSYSERLFKYPEIGALEPADAIAAIKNPASAEGVKFEENAIKLIMKMTQCYPYFLQQWAYEAWNISEDNVISESDVKKANLLAIRELDQSFFKVRYERCTPAERKYMRALAEFGPGRHRSGDVAEKMKVKVTSVAPIRNSLIKKGMVYSPAHGDTEFTVPLFDEYMRREVPDLEGMLKKAE